MVQKLPRIERFCDAPSVQLYTEQWCRRGVGTGTQKRATNDDFTWHGLITPSVGWWLVWPCHMPPNVPRCPMAPVRPLTTGPIVLVSPAPLHLSTLGWQQTAGVGKNRFQVTRCPPAASAGPDADLTTSNYGSCEERIGRPQKHQLWTFLIPTSFMFIIPCCGHVSNMVVPHWWVLFGCWNCPKLCHFSSVTT